MNEADRAAFYEAEEEYEDIISSAGLTAEEQGQIEEWFPDDPQAQKLLAARAEMSEKDAYILLHRVYAGGTPSRRDLKRLGY